MSFAVIPVLTSKNLPLTKTWRKDGTIEGYGKAKWFTLKEEIIEDIEGLSALLTSLESRPYSAIIRGQYVGFDKSLEIPETDDGIENRVAKYVRRTLEYFKDCPQPFLLVEVDNFVPQCFDPIAETEDAIREYILGCLPPQFHDVAYHWQLSSSAGHPSKKGSLRVHLWFWLKEPATSGALRAWAESIGLMCDRTVFNPVQVHYTSAPIVEKGAPEAFDTLRSCFYAGSKLELDLTEQIKPYEGQLVESRRDLAMEDEELDDPRFDWLLKNWIVLRKRNDGDLDVRCPFDFTHDGGKGEKSQKPGDSSSIYFRAGTNGFKRGHWKCQHHSCFGRTDEELDRQAGYDPCGFDDITTLPSVTQHLPTYEDKQVVFQQAETEAPTLLRDVNGLPTNELVNCVNALRSRNFCGVPLAKDDFLDMDMIGAGPVSDEGEAVWRPITDDDYTRLRVKFSSLGMRRVGVDDTRNAVALVCAENRFDSAKEWLNGLQWDGVPRIDDFCAKYLRTTDTEYAAATGAYMWTALAGRVLSPGIKCDMVPVLIGKEGVRKSTAVMTMAPREDMFVELSLQTRDDDQARLMRGKLISEISELRGLETRDRESILAFLTRTHDEWIPKYKEKGIIYPRRLLFVGTTNDIRFLTENTGRRRWLPLMVGGKHPIDTTAIAQDRFQLWAEGAARFRTKGVEFQKAEMLARAVHADHENVDPWVGMIAQWLESKKAFNEETNGELGFLVQEMLVDAMQVRPRDVNRYMSKRGVAALEKLGCESRRESKGIMWYTKLPNQEAKIGD